jgi:hypothetical protein
MKTSVELLKKLLTLIAIALLCSQPSAAQEKRNLRVAYVSPSYSIHQLDCQRDRHLQQARLEY